MPIDPYFTSGAKHDQIRLKLDDPSRPPAEKWPRLSKQLSHPRRPDTCQSCGRKPDGLGMEKLADRCAWLERWIEHDDYDRPERIIVVLCPSCAGRLVKPHPRLYSQMPAFKPWPGTIPHLCADCVHCVDLKCNHPDLKANGGEGLMIKCAQPMRAMIDGADPVTRKRTGWIQEIWPAPAESCTGRKLE
jgi:hypothetical protein